MSWSSGSQLFCDFWPLIKKAIKKKKERLEFTADLLEVFERWDIDLADLDELEDEELYEAQKILAERQES
ncbi:MAG: hypothetical protein KC777_03375 [Cyanobacteria bacterium HKST-UBA02]|nr:hypothetical protein [Cyanobacteria bacterium HKST-UBA02]